MVFYPFMGFFKSRIDATAKKYEPWDFNDSRVIETSARGSLFNLADKMVGIIGDIHIAR